MVDESGISVVVGAVLIVAVLIPTFLFFSYFYNRHAIYVLEQRHFEEVKTSFSEIQLAMSILPLGGTTIVSMPMSEEPVPNVVGFFPLLFGKTESTASGLAFENHTLKFYSGYLEYPNSKIVLENGAVILLGENSMGMLFPPPVLGIRENQEITREISIDGIKVMAGKVIEIYHTVYKLEGEDFGISATGTLNVGIRLENEYFECPFDGERFENKAQYENHMATVHGWPLDNITIRFYTSYENSWYDYLLIENDWLKGRGYHPSIKKGNGYVDFTILGAFEMRKDVYNNLIRDVMYYRKVRVIEIKTQA